MAPQSATPEHAEEGRPYAERRAPHPPRVLAQASTAKPRMMRYTAKGANPRRRTQAMNQATLA